MTWWCAATGEPWSWAWRAYPGVWLFVALLLVGFWRWGRAPEAGEAEGRRAAASWGLGVAVVWAALDWPIGTLGAGYLASLHAVQYVLLALVAPPFLLSALGPRLRRWAERRPGARAWLRRAAHPLAGLAGYNLILFVTHVPGVVDGLMETQLGSLAIDLAWIASGLLLWWPVTAPPALARVSPPLQMGYLFVQTIPATAPAAFLTFADYPLYRLYELAPRVSPMLPAGSDLQVAGLIMKVVGDPVLWIGIAVVFFRWANAERRADLATRGGLPAPPTRM
jgi:putative membrane protein